MEWVAAFAGLPKTDRPACTNALVASIAMHLNDALDDEARQGLKELIPELAAAVRTADDSRVDRRVALWCAQTMPAPTGAGLRALHEAALEAAGGYLDGHVSEARCRAAAAAAAEAGARMGSIALYVAADAAHAAVADDPGSAVFNAAAGAVDWALGTGEPVEWFRALLSAHAAARNADTGVEMPVLKEAVCSPA
ncbi:MAG TPA: hypothetical protein VF180_11110 [Acidimicrobiia bacterium]